MNAFKRFFLGFLLGIGVMYWVLHHGDETWRDAWTWMNKSASAYRGDSAHQKAKEALGE